MIKRNAKRALSVFLSIVLTVTAFFIFDQSVFKIDTGAYADSTQTTMANDDVFFYVPEVIYLTPSTTGETGSVPFKWFADRANADNGEITKSVADKNAGSVYFHCAIAVSYIINVSLPDGCTISNVNTGTWTSGNSYATDQMTGSALNKQGQTITWTLTWSDGIRNYTTIRYSRIYKTNYVPSGGSGESITSVATACADETYTYYYGENVITGFNDLSSSPDRGYVNYGYASGNFSSGSLTLGTGNNTYTFAETPSLEYTYVYLKKSLVTFNANGGPCSTASKSLTFDSTYGALPTPTRTGYTFNGWFTATSGGSKVETTTVVNTGSNHTLYAQWTANSYFKPAGTCVIDSNDFSTLARAVAGLIEINQADPSKS